MQKLEFYEESKLAEKEDRGIQFRSPVYNAALARHLHHVERAIYDHITNVDGTPVIAKGYSPLERGLILDAMAERFTNPRFMCIDHSRFDAHVNEHLLDEEHKTYLRLRAFNKELKRLLRWQRKTMGFSHGGIVYRAAAKRMSGDLNTALGNSLLNYAMLKAYLEYYGIDGSILLDGDDAVIVFEALPDGKELPSLAEFCENFGMKTECHTVDDIRLAEFCQCRVVYTREGPVMARNPRKVLDVLVKCPRKLDAERARGVLAASALGELMQAPGLPVISVAAAALCRYAGSKPMFVTPDEWGRFQTYKTTDIVTTVDDTARADFAFAWDIPLCDQFALEAYYQDLPGQEKPIELTQPKEKPLSFELWDDCQTFWAPTRAERWWRARWGIGKLLPPVDLASSYNCI
jgi:hypothetical protein